MELSEKIELLKTELGLFSNYQYRRFAEMVLEEVPDYFFTVAASATGKYHPAFAQGEGGLLRHTQAAMRIAKQLFNIYSFTEQEQNEVFMALLFHDSVKRGLNGTLDFTVTLHPEYAANLVRKVYYDNIDRTFKLVTGMSVNTICNAIESHMGQWNGDYSHKEVLPIPVSKVEKFVHLCDYLGSRKLIEVNFDVEV